MTTDESEFDDETMFSPEVEAAFGRLREATPPRLGPVPRASRRRVKTEFKGLAAVAVCVLGVWGGWFSLLGDSSETVVTYDTPITATTAPVVSTPNPTPVAPTAVAQVSQTDGLMTPAPLQPATTIPVSPTATSISTSTVVPPTPTATDTPATPTATSTVVPPTPTATVTPEPTSTPELDCLLTLNRLDGLDNGIAHQGLLEGGPACSSIETIISGDSPSGSWAEITSYCVVDGNFLSLNVWLKVEGPSATGWILRSGPDNLFATYGPAEYLVYNIPATTAASQTVTFDEVNDTITQILLRGSPPDPGEWMTGCRETDPGTHPTTPEFGLMWRPPGW